MPEDEKPKRKPPRSYRPPKHLEAEFDRRLSLSGLSFNAFITEAWHGRSRHRPDENRKLGQLLAQAATISDQLHEIKLSGADSSTLLLEQCRDELLLIRSEIMARLGRKS